MVLMRRFPGAMPQAGIKRAFGPPTLERAFNHARVALSHAVRISLAAAVLCRTVLAAEPILNHLYPVAGQQGTTIAVTASGKFEPWPLQMWVDAPGITFKPAKVAGKFDVEIAMDAPVGPHLVRLCNEQGASAPRFFIVSREPEIAEAEPNDYFKSPQKIASLPSTICGRLDKAGDVDSFAVTLKRGQTLVAWVEAYVLASTFDGLLRIVNADGTQFAFNHDGRTLDPFLAWEAPCDGTFVVQIMGFVLPASSTVQLTGGDGCVYRLHLTAGPFVRHMLPLAAQRGKKTPVELLGWNLTSARAEIDGTQFAPQATTLELALPGISSDRVLDISDVPEFVEKEPNDFALAAQRIEIPGAVSGRISTAMDEDRFVFAAVKGRTYAVAVTAGSIGSPLEPWLKIEDKTGKELARNDDNKVSRDPELTWTAPSDGDHIAAIGDLTHRGGGGFVYRLAIAESAPTVTATVASHSLSVESGKSVEFKVAVKRANGFKPKLRLIAGNLPEGATSDAADVPDKDGEVGLKITADAGAALASQPVQFVLREIESGIEHPVRYFLTTMISKNESAPRASHELLLNSTEHIWLAVLPGAKK